MIDLHNHILPEWDDGPNTLDKALEMARQAVSVGTTVMVASPHRFCYGRQSLAHIVQERVDLLNSQLQSNAIPLSIIPGVEIPIDDDVVREVTAGNLTPLGAGRFLLMETPFTDLSEHLHTYLKHIIDAGYGIVLAHPERNAEVQKRWAQSADLPFVEACIELGCFVQLTSGSIVGRFGPSALAVSRAIIQHRDWKIVISSDSHDPKERTPGLLGRARDTAAAWMGDAEAARAMVDELPAKIVGLRS